MHEALEKYVETLKQLGDITHKEIEYAIIVDFISYLLDSEYTKYVKKKDIMLFSKYLSCVFAKSCLFKDLRIMHQLDVNKDIMYGYLSKLDSIDDEHNLRLHNADLVQIIPYNK